LNDGTSRHPAKEQPIQGARSAAMWQFSDRLVVSRDLVALIWQHRLWWLVPVAVSLLILSVLVVLQATPVGPLLYPLF